MDGANEGIVMHGGTLDADVLAVGRGAQAVKNVAASAAELEVRGQVDVAQALRDLVAAIEAHAPALEHPDELVRSTQIVAHELAAPQPNGLTIRALLDGLVHAAGSVSAVAQAATALQVVAGALL